MLNVSCTLKLVPCNKTTFPTIKYATRTLFQIYEKDDNETEKVKHAIFADDKCDDGNRQQGTLSFSISKINKMKLFER
jgi:hypothetical protein